MSSEWWADEPTERQPLFEQKYPGRIQVELNQFAPYGAILDVVRDFWEIGLFAVDYEWLHKGAIIPLRIVYPATFPRVRPKVFLRSDRSTYPRRHCDPLDGAICYLGQSEHQWRPNDSIAQLIQQQLPKVLDQSFEPEEEDQIPEPAERWWNAFSADGSCLLIDSSWSTSGTRRGTLTVAYRVANAAQGVIRAVVVAVKDGVGNELARWDGPLPVEFQGCAQIQMPWIRADTEQFPNKAGEVVNAFAAQVGELKAKALGDGLVGSFFAIQHPTELEYGTEGESWICFMQFGSWKSFKPSAKEPPKTVTLRTLRAGKSDLLSRSPAAAKLANKMGLVAGIGAIGGTIAMELARNGLPALTLVDQDYVTPGNSVRWPLGQPAWGMGKSEALNEFIRTNYPTCVVEPLRLDIGEYMGGRTLDGIRLVNAIEQANVLVDATTSFGVLGSLYDVCSSSETPLISASATPNVKGGTVTLFTPTGGCPTCLLFHYSDGAIAPPAGEGEAVDLVSAVGCSQVAFTGTSFDLQEISLQAVRIAVQAAEGPMRRLSIVHTLSFEDSTYGPMPKWEAVEFAKHEACNCQT